MSLLANQNVDDYTQYNMNIDPNNERFMQYRDTQSCDRNYIEMIIKILNIQQNENQKDMVLKNTKIGKKGKNYLLKEEYSIK